jgi:hypothetical protein
MLSRSDEGDAHQISDPSKEDDQADSMIWLWIRHSSDDRDIPLPSR